MVIKVEECPDIKTESKSEDTKKIHESNSVRHESLKLFEIPEDLITEKCEVKIEKMESSPATECSSVIGDSQLEDCQLIKMEFKSDDIEEIYKCGFAIHESVNQYNIPKNVTFSKYEVKSEEIDILYPSMQFEQGVNGKACSFPDSISFTDRSSNINSNTKEIEKQRLSTGASSFKSNVAQREKPISFSCFHCDYSTNTRKYLANHMIVHAKRKKKFSYVSCNYLNSSKHGKRSLGNHIIKNHKNHIDIVSSKVHNCETCDYRTTIKGNLRRHMFHKHSVGEIHACTCCMKHFKNKRSLDDHIIKNHQNLVDLVENKVNNCQTCDYKTTVKSNLERHMKIHSANYEKKHSCTCCQKHFKSKLLLDDHIIQNHQNFVDLVSSKVYNCLTCDYRTTKKDNLRIHRIRVHSENDKKHSCSCCEKQFTQKKYLDDHIIQSHQNLINYVSNKVHNCQACDYRTTIKDKLRIHRIQVHSENGEKHSYKCCEKQFTQKRYLDEHIIQNHQNFDLVSSKVHSCQTCNYRTTIKRNLRRHMINIHSVDEKHSCTCCERQFTEKRSLDDHIIQNHHDLLNSVSSKVHHCPTCDYRTTKTYSLSQHIRTHSGNYEKHLCTYCEKQFKSKPSVDDHIIHNHQNFLHLVSSKIHSCQTCDYKTTKKDHLERHTIRVHSQNNEKHS